jgi:hypothetical protein
MDQRHPKTWLQITLLLAALATGSLMTRFVPTFEQVAAVRDAKAAQAAEAEQREVRTDVSNSHVHQRYLRFSRTTS